MIVAKGVARADGVERFAHQIDLHPLVAKVIIGNLRSAKVAPRRRPPIIKPIKTGVSIQYFAGGRTQRLLAVPAPGITMKQLAAALQLTIDD